MTPYSPPLHTVYVYKVYLFTQEGGGRANQREGQRGNSSQAGRKYQHDWLYLHSPVNKLY